jgi:hypothetical protein
MYLTSSRTVRTVGTAIYSSCFAAEDEHVFRWRLDVRLLHKGFARCKNPALVDVALVGGIAFAQKRAGPREDEKAAIRQELPLFISPLDRSGECFG